MFLQRRTLPPPLLVLPVLLLLHQSGTALLGAAQRGCSPPFLRRARLGSLLSAPLFSAPEDVAASVSASSAAHSYASYWEDLLIAEHRELSDKLRRRRSRWSSRRLEERGMSILGGHAEPETELFGEKVVRVTRQEGGGEARLRLDNKFSRGDVLLLSPDGDSFSGRRRSGGGSFVPKECCVVDVGEDWIDVGVGATWPAGLWEVRRHPGACRVRLDRAAPSAPLLAQRKSLQMVRNGGAGDVAALLAATFRSDVAEGMARDIAAETPMRFLDGAVVGGVSRHKEPLSLQRAVRSAVAAAKNAANFNPNRSQEDAIEWALGRRISLIRGPPGTGKTRVAALLISAAIRLRSVPASTVDDGDSVSTSQAPPRVLAVTHSNGAADVLLEALLEVGVPAVRAGRPATVSTAARRRTVMAMAETHPEVVALRRRSNDATLPPHVRSAARADAFRIAGEVRRTISEAAPVVVASCIGAHQLLQDGRRDGAGRGTAFPLVVLDEAAQTTEPAMLCALAAADAEQVVAVGDTRQLPPTVASESAELRAGLGLSPMARLEAAGVEGRTLRVQYRMPPSLLEHPSTYFYGGLIRCAEGGDGRPLAEECPPGGFPWPGGSSLAFVHVSGRDLEAAHDFGGRSNPTEAGLVAGIVTGLLEAGDVGPGGVCVISPYSKQVDRIRAELAGRGGAGARGVRVGTVDSFQGREADVVVFSATRSNEEGELGFLRDPRRLCVAITRAKRGLVLVGDDGTLRKSRHWAALINSCRGRGCYVEVEDLVVGGRMDMPKK